MGMGNTKGPAPFPCLCTEELKNESYRERLCWLGMESKQTGGKGGNYSLTA